MLGYREGQQTGAFTCCRTMDVDGDIKNNKDMDRDQVCNEIRDYKLSIARDLDENDSDLRLARHGRPVKFRLTQHQGLPPSDAYPLPIYGWDRIAPLEFPIVCNC